jgi:hypothetical protein
MNGPRMTYSTFRHIMLAIQWIITKLFSSLEKAASLILFCWAYAIGWSIPPFVGWGKYIPEGYLKYDN